MVGHQNEFGNYKGRKVMIIRPQAVGDKGYDPTRDDLVVIRYEDEPHETGHETPEFIVARSEVTPSK